MKRLIPFLASPTSYPITGVYLIGVTLTVGVSEQVISVVSALILFTLVTVLALFVAMFREVRVVHALVNSQRDDLLNRISDLIDALHAAGVEIPAHRDGDTSDTDRTTP